MNDLSNQIDKSYIEMNTTKDLIQKMNDENNLPKSEIGRTNLLSYIATGLNASALILVAIE